MAEEIQQKYNLPEDHVPQMVGESLVTTHKYAEDLQYGIDILKSASPEDLHNIVIYLSGLTQSKKVDNAQKDKFEKLLEKWWNETCMYSGSNLCYSNPNFMQMKAMGVSIIPLIAEKERTAPDFMQRHIGWLKNGISRW